MTMSLKEYCKQFTGVDIHGSTLRIRFSYRGVKCAETLKGIRLTKSNVAFANNKRTAILHEIATGSFDYRHHFPHSDRANIFSRAKSVPTVEEAINNWIKHDEKNVRPKQHSINRGRCKNYIIPRFSKRKIDEITFSEIEDWRKLELTETLSNKTINDVMIPFRAIYRTAQADRVIDYSPFDHLESLKRLKPDEPDPFTLAEIQVLENTDTHYVSEKAALLFSIWSGLRVSEWMAMAWEDVDLAKGEVKIRRSVVDNKYGLTKTDQSNRTVKLLDQAIKILQAQRAITQRSELKKVEVLQEDNRTYKKESLRFVFINTKTNEPFRGASAPIYNFVKGFLEKCNLRYRGINQARHTHASQLLTRGIPERWIIKQMGWNSINMFEKTYGRWIDAEIPDMAKRASELLNGCPPDVQNKTNLL